MLAVASLHPLEAAERGAEALSSPVDDVVDGGASRASASDDAASAS